MAGFDCVTHLDDPLVRDVRALAAAARRGGVSDWVVAAGDPARWDAVEEAARLSGGVAALGAHPWWAVDADAAVRQGWLAELDRRRPAVVGEIGLDHFRAKQAGARAAQRAVFREQLAWAREHDLPVLLHVVRALPEVLDVLRHDGLPASGGIVHGWTGTPDQALAAVAAGLHVSVGPLVLTPSGHKVRATLASIPRERVLLETDCPARLPDGTLSAPLYLREVAAGVGRVWGVPADVVLAETGASARRLLRV